MNPIHQVVDAKIAAASVSSVGGGVIGVIDLVNPALETMSLLISCVSGTLAIWWTIERLLELRRNMRKADKP